MSNFLQVLKYKYNMKAILKRRAGYIIKQNETLEDVCKKFNVNIANIKLYNMISDVEEGDIVFFPESKNGLYVVKPADTFDGIAKKLGMTEQQLFKITGTTRLFIGQRIEF